QLQVPPIPICTRFFRLRVCPSSHAQPPLSRFCLLFFLVARRLENSPSPASLEIARVLSARRAVSPASLALLPVHIPTAMPRSAPPAPFACHLGRAAPPPPFAVVASSPPSRVLPARSSPSRSAPCRYP